MKLPSKLISAFIISMLMTHASAQVPTYDNRTVFQLIEQVRTAQQQLTQLQQTANALRGDRQLGALLDLIDDPAIRAALPPSVVDVLKGGSGAGISGDIEAIIRSMPRTTGDDAQRQRAIASQEAYAREAYRQATLRNQELLKRLRAADSSDLKAIADLQLAVQTESFIIANENIKLQSLALAAQQAEKVMAERQKGAARSFLLSGSSALRGTSTVAPATPR